MVISPTLLAVLAAAAIAAPSSMSLSITPSPPKHPPKSLSSRSSSSRRPTNAPITWNRGDGRRSRQHQSSTTPLRAYTVAENNNSVSWLSLLKIPSFDKLSLQFGAVEDSLFSFEGGIAAKAVTRPLTPNLVAEETMGTSMEKDDLLSESSAFTIKAQQYMETIKSYELKVESLEKKLTVSLERQDQQLLELQQQKEAYAVKEEESVDSGLVKSLEDDNQMLRLRLRALEVELSDIAFESRKAILSPPTTPAKSDAVAMDDNNANVETAPSSADGATLTPKAPSAPVPPHLYQQRQLELLQLVKQYKEERSSVSKLFGLCIRRGASKVGRALNLWNPTYNLQLWGELRGHKLAV